MEDVKTFNRAQLADTIKRVKLLVNSTMKPLHIDIILEALDRLESSPVDHDSVWNIDPLSIAE